MKSIALILAVIAGAALPLQTLLNAKLAAPVGGALSASLVSFLVGSAALLVVVLALRSSPPSWSALASLPWWLWTGGLLGAVFVAIATLTVPLLGATALLVLVLLGQLVGAMALDHFAVLADVARPITWQRFGGVLLVLVGAGLVLRG